MYISTMPTTNTMPAESSALIVRGFPLQLHDRNGHACRVRRHPHSLGDLGAGVGKTVGTAAASSGAKVGASMLAAHFGAAAAAVPIIGAAAAAVVMLLTNLLGKHGIKVKQEANTLNNAIPVYYGTIQQVVSALNSGQIGAATAISQIDAAVSNYYTNVQSMIKKSGPCPYNQSTGEALVNAKGLPQGLSTCNGPCSVGCDYVEPDARRLKTAINGSGGSIAVARNMSGHAGFQGMPSFTLNVKGSGVSALSSSLGGTPSWVWLAGGGGLLLILMFSMRR